MNIVLQQVPMPRFQFAEEIPSIPAEEYERRLSGLTERAQSDWVIVYADREHYANLTYLVNYDPRFEEALLVLGKNGKRVLIVGNEGMGYLSVLTAPLEVELCQTFSLQSQPRSTAPRLKDVLARLGFASGQSVSAIGWKYLEASEQEDETSPAFLPAFFVDLLRGLVGSTGKVTDGTALLMHPEDGLRATNSADQIAAFEWAARNTSAAIFSVLRGARPGMSELQAMQLMQYSGFPMSMHPIFTSGKGAVNGLRSPSAKVIEYGDAVSTAVGYWGSLCCRAGMLLGEPDESFFEQVAAPYFQAIATWYRTVSLNISGKDVFQAVAQAFAGSGFRSSLNPGHLGSYEEWLSSPIRPDSTEKIRSGMLLQSDIIPTPLPAGQLINCEDTVAMADESLRAEIRAKYPDLWQRIQDRRKLMSESLGIYPAEELLPLTDGATYLPPFWLAEDLVCVVG